MFNGTKEQFIIEQIENLLNNKQTLSSDDYDSILISAEEEFND